MDIKNGQTYQIKGNSEYFLSKYGHSNPFIVIEGTDREALGQFWGGINGNPAVMFYGMRAGLEDLPLGGQVYYGKIGQIGELVHESELKEVTIQ